MSIKLSKLNSSSKIIDKLKVHSDTWAHSDDYTRNKHVQPSAKGSEFMQGKQWLFMKDGLDDFRDGIPPLSDSDFITNANRGLAPNIRGGTTKRRTYADKDMTRKKKKSNAEFIKQPAMTKRYTKDELCYTKLTPIQKQRRTHIKEIEYGLLQHPLALHVHFEECLPSELFEDVVDLLDPEMNMIAVDYDDETTSASSSCSPSPPSVTATGTPNKEVDVKSDEHQSCGSNEMGEYAKLKGIITDDLDRSDEAMKCRNPYRALAWKDDREKLRKSKYNHDHRQNANEDDHIASVTKDFCDWVAGLGGDSNNIEENTITSLFASGYETKPALSVPIHVVELTNVPAELRMTSNVGGTSDAASNQGVAKSTKKPTGYEPSWLKYDYGAWYLPTSLWKKRLASEPLVDPAKLKNEELSRTVECNRKLDNELASLHGAKAFMDFVDKEAVRRPQFLTEVACIKQQRALEEQARIQSEMAKLRRPIVR